jgi:SAM-dependent methyltransferase
MGSVSVEVVSSLLNNCTQSDFSENVEADFHLNHPRYRALKRMSGRILDIGSGDGGIGQLIGWPVRLTGKSLVGCDLDQMFPLPNFYTDWISGGWERVSKSEKFGGIFVIHVIEHLVAWREMLSFAVSVLKDDEFLYIEWPVNESVSWPTASEIWLNFTKHQPKFSNQLLSTFNFYDDGSHVDRPPTMEEVLTHLSGVQIIESGPIRLQDFSAELVSKGLKEQSVSSVTLGIWAEFGFAQFVLAQKRNTHSE